MVRTVRWIVAVGVVLLLATWASAADDIFKATALGKRHLVEEFLAQDAKVANARDKRGNTALHYAARHNRTKIAKLLIDKGAKVSRANKKTGETPLHVAATKGSTGVATLLLASKANVNAVNKKGSPPLHHALRNGHATIAKALLDGGASLTIDGEYGTTLHYAATGGLKEYVEKCLAKGFDINGEADQDGDTPLHKAVWRGSKEFVAYLIGKGADPKALNYGRWTPLHEAAKAGNPAACEALLDAGADLEAPSKKAVTPLHAAVIYCGNQKRKLEVLRLLIARKADPNPIDEGTGDTPLHSAVLYGDKKGEVVGLLLASGAKRTAWNGKKQTALDLAKEKGKKAAVAALEKSD